MNEARYRDAEGALWSRRCTLQQGRQPGSTAWSRWDVRQWCRAWPLPPFMLTVRGFSPQSTITDEVLDGVKAPTTLVWGADDTFGGEDVATALEHRLVDAELHLLPRSGHLPWLDEPQRCGELTSEFLRRAG